MARARQIIHVDMDAFYASVEVLDDAALMGRPVVVGGDPKKRGVVSAASYEARKFGVHSAMPMSRAVRLCPHAVVLPVRMGRYVEISRGIHAIFERFTPIVEPISIDEAFLDVTGSIGIWKDAEEIGHTIKKNILDELGLVASVGIAPNKFLAKLGSDLDKPDGFCVITEANKQQVLDPLPVGRIWGVGKVASERLKSYGIATIEQLRKTHPEHLKAILGNSGQLLLELAHGVDGRDVELPGRAKSISHEQTFAEDVGDVDVLLTVLTEQVESVATRLRNQKMLTKTITLKFRYGNFQTITRSMTFSEPTDITAVLWDAGKAIFCEWSKASFRPLRLIGFGASHLKDHASCQGKLFVDAAEEKQKRIDRVTDQIKGRYGKDVIGHKY